jgi:hypothetical protein
MQARLFFALASVLAVAACSNVEQARAPAIGRLSWFALLEGRDIREACVPGAPARYRLVYNGNYEDQTRVYDLVRTPDGASLRTVVSTANITLFSYDGSAKNPWRPERESTANLDLETYRAVARAVEADGFGAPTRTEIAFPSWSYYWIVSACAEGRFHINGWLAADKDGAKLTFPALLMAQDKTEITFAEPTPNPFADHRERVRRVDSDRSFEVRLTPQGIFGTTTIF